MHNSNVHVLNIRQIGLLVCFSRFKAKNGRYPISPAELSTVTSTKLPQHRFDEYERWFYDYTGEPRK